MATLFEYAGGAPAMRKLAGAHYRRCQTDPVLVEVFGTTPRPEHVQHLADWLGEVFGGPAVYTQQHGGHNALLQHHAGFHITEGQRQRFVEAFLEAADEAGWPADERFRTRVKEYVEWGSAIALDVSQSDEVPHSDQPVPGWDW
ncbi:group II truncated hemoglobin [Flindersiella endophytica]